MSGAFVHTKTAFVFAVLLVSVSIHEPLVVASRSEVIEPLNGVLSHTLRELASFSLDSERVLMDSSSFL
jgi:hypothetical protein